MQQAPDSALSMSNLKKLPRELLLEVGSFLDRHAVVALGSSCRELNQLSKDDGIWLSLYQRDFSPSLLPELRSKPGHCLEMYKLSLQADRESFIENEMEMDLSPDGVYMIWITAFFADKLYKACFIK